MAHVRTSFVACPLAARALVMALIASSLVTAGCDRPWSDTPSADLLTRSDEGSSERSALLGGTLEVDPERGCVLLSGKPVVWPKGTTMRVDPPQIRLPSGLVANPGDAISGGGGELQASTIQETATAIEGDVDKALACARSGREVVVFSARGDDMVVTREGSGDRLAWASELGRASEISDPVMAQRIQRAARESGARLLDVVVLQLRNGRRAPALTLEASDPASFMKHELQGFLDQIGFSTPGRYAFVELIDDEGRFAWSAGRFPNGGMVHPRPDLDQCSPIVHSQPVGLQVPPCPAD